MISTKYKYSEDELRNAVSSSVSYAETLRRLGIPVRGNNAETLKTRISEYGIDTSHFTGHARHAKTRSRDINDYLTNKKGIKSHLLLLRLVSCGLKREVCEECGVGAMWNGMPLQLQLHHVDGDSANNQIENLKVVCPNCHSQTANYKNKRWENYEKPKYFCRSCGRQLRTKCASQLCLYCSAKTRRKAERPDYDTLVKEVKELGYRGTGRKYGVSDRAIKKWVQSMEQSTETKQRERI